MPRRVLLTLILTGSAAAVGVVAIGLHVARRQQAVARATREVAELDSALECYDQDEGEYPGMRLERDPQRNDFPLLFEALLGLPRPEGKGGRSAPYVLHDPRSVAVRVEKLHRYRPARFEEVPGPGIEKFLLDPWGNPYVYRLSRGHHPMAEIYSLGPDGVDQTARAEAGDDIGNW